MSVAYYLVLSPPASETEQSRTLDRDGNSFDGRALVRHAGLLSQVTSAANLPSIDFFLGGLDDVAEEFGVAPLDDAPRFHSAQDGRAFCEGVALALSRFDAAPETIRDLLEDIDTIKRILDAAHAAGRDFHLALDF